MISIIRLTIRAFSRGARQAKRIPTMPVETIDTPHGHTGASIAKVLWVIDGDTVDVKSRGAGSGSDWTQSIARKTDNLGAIRQKPVS